MGASHLPPAITTPNDLTPSNPAQSATLDNCVAIMNAARPTSPALSHRGRRSGAKTSRQNTRTSSGVNRSGINSEASHGTQVPTHNSPIPGSSHQAGRPGASTRQTSSSTQEASSACATTTGQVVSVRCRGSMNRL